MNVTNKNDIALPLAINIVISEIILSLEIKYTDRHALTRINALINIDIIECSIASLIFNKVVFSVDCWKFFVNKIA